MPCELGGIMSYRRKRSRVNDFDYSPRQYKYLSHNLWIEGCDFCHTALRNKTNQSHKFRHHHRSWKEYRRTQYREE